MPSFSIVSGSAAGLSLAVPLQPNQIPPACRSADNSPTARPPAGLFWPGMARRLETATSRLMAHAPGATAGRSWGSHPQPGGWRSRRADLEQPATQLIGIVQSIAGGGRRAVADPHADPAELIDHFEGILVA